jgi:hypothetical protein
MAHNQAVRGSSLLPRLSTSGLLQQQQLQQQVLLLLAVMVMMIQKIGQTVMMVQRFTAGARSLAIASSQGEEEAGAAALVAGVGAAARVQQLATPLRLKQMLLQMQMQALLRQIQTLQLGLSTALAVAQLQQRAAMQLVGRAAAAVAASASRSHQQTPLRSSLWRFGAPSCTTEKQAT